MISPRRPAAIALLTFASVVLAMIGLACSYSCVPDSWRYRNEIARTEQAAVKIEAYRQTNGRYPDDKDAQAFKSMALQFDHDFLYASSGQLHSTPEAPLLIFIAEAGCKVGTYDLAHKRWDFIPTAC